MRDRLRVLLGRSLAHVLVEQTRGAALHIITDTGIDEDARAAAPGVRVAPVAPDWRGYASAFGFVALAGGVAAAADRYMANANLAMIFLCGVLVAGAAFGFGPGLAAAACAAVTYNFFFLDRGSASPSATPPT